ncbi:SAM-dependent methyltransferase [Actinocrinis puniceicyclus]|uniref:SAM-dependent methyltransferase n=1 Tax=Actinocrinis puniceicyclus TaxID=977794 RepID=A0A8J7WVX4_9ACTN|nr:SAM-dependent methyltransferase [Actinocrinis puniceicyclus]MBS2966109.1 SAM-dependent methyltransferase [Actinocrinis puniceicyclus]
MVGQTETRPWSQAMQQALYGPGGFYRSGAGPAAHFRTSVHASPLFAAAVLRLLGEVDEALNSPDELALVDVGAGRGELLEAVWSEASARETLSRRLRLIAVDLADRPGELDPVIEWRHTPPREVTGLLIANEWLDNVPCDVVEATRDGWRVVEVAADGAERIGSAPNPLDQEWLSTWWPKPETADTEPDPPPRAEIGLSRDAAWAEAVATLDRGVAIAIDYAHVRESRPPFGTLAGYAGGRQVMPAPDGSCDITAHVALDSCAATARADWTVHSTQREVFHSLGITGGRPELALAASDPRGYLRALAQASTAAELTDPHGLGAFGWLVQGVAVPVPASLTGL